MNLRQKLLLAQAPLLIALVVLGLVAVRTVSRLGVHSQSILKDNYRSVLAAQRMKEAVERIDSAALFILAGHREDGEKMVIANRGLFEAELAVQLGNITEPGEEAESELLRQRWKDYLGHYEEFLARTAPDQAKTVYFSALLPRFYAVKDQADVILAMNQDAMVRKSEEVAKFSHRMDALILATAVGAALAGLIAAIVLLNKMIRPLTGLSLAVRRIGQGDFASRAPVTGKDEIALLARDFNTMAEGLERYRKSSLGDLMLAQHTVQAAIDSLPDPIMAFDLGGVLISVNRAAEEGLGMTLDASLTDPVVNLDPALRLAVDRARRHVLSGKGPYLPQGFDEAVRVASGGTDSFYLPQATPIYDDMGNLAGVTVVLRDVGILRRLDEMSSDLVATFAHEFRTPLTSLHMAVHVCLEQVAGPLTEKQQDLLHAAREDCERLQGMVHDLLDIARIQSGRVAIERRQVDVCSAIDHVLAKHRLLAEEKGIAASRSVPPDCDTVFVDPNRLELVLSNFLQNAVRHTPSGGVIELRAERTASGVRFAVSDTGEGIPAEYRTKIFDKFFRIPGRTGGGTGLGLTIAKNIVEAYGGHIGVDSVEGRGSTFWFDIPAEPGTKD